MCWCHDPPPMGKQRRWATAAALLIFANGEKLSRRRQLQRGAATSEGFAPPPPSPPPHPPTPCVLTAPPRCPLPTLTQSAMHCLPQATLFISFDNLTTHWTTLSDFHRAMLLLTLPPAPQYAALAAELAVQLHSRIRVQGRTAYVAGRRGAAGPQGLRTNALVLQALVSTPRSAPAVRQGQEAGRWPGDLRTPSCCYLCPSRRPFRLAGHWQTCH